MAESEIYLQARKFAKENIAPWAKIVDEENRFATEAFEKIREAGYLKLVIPAEQGGWGKGVAEFADVCRAFAESCGSVGLCYMMHNIMLFSVLDSGNEDLKQRIIADVIDNGALCGLAHSEFTTGIHFYVPTGDIRIEGDNAIINVSKSMVTSGSSGSYYQIHVPSPDAESGYDHFIVPTDAPGVTIDMDSWHAMGMRANVSCPMHLKDAVIPLANRVNTEPGTGAAHEMVTSTPAFILGLAAVYTGLMQHILESTIEHANKRKYPSGHTIGQHDLAAANIAEIYGRVQACTTLTKEAARAFVTGEEDALLKILAARMLSVDDVIDMSKLGMRIGAGAAYAGVGDLERLTRDAFGGHIMAPGADMLHLWLGRVLLGNEMIDADLDI